MAKEKKYKRILLKLSGEELMGDEGFGIDPKVLDRMALEIGQLVGIGVQVGLVIGGRGIRITVPAVVGFKPNSDLRMAFSISGTRFFSHGVTDRVLESSTETEAAWLRGVSTP